MRMNGIQIDFVALPNTGGTACGDP